MSTITLNKLIRCIYADRPEIFENKKLAEILDQFHIWSDQLKEKWIKSKETDFSIYNDQRYVADSIICFNYVSKGSILGSFKYFKKNNIDLSKLAVFEDYNGIGITTLPLLQAGFKSVSVFNDVEIQAAIFRRLLSDFFENPTINIFTKRSNIPMSDIIYSLEIVEHFKEPIKYLEELYSKINPNGYLIYGSGFRNMFPGHYSEYIDASGNKVSNRKISMQCQKFLKEHFALVHVGFNRKPMIFKKK